MIKNFFTEKKKGSPTDHLDQNRLERLSTFSSGGRKNQWDFRNYAKTFFILLLVSILNVSVGFSQASCDVTPAVPNANYLGQFGKSHYFKMHSSGTWTEAITLTQTLGGRLPKITTAAQNTWLANVIGSDVIWIGVSDAALEGNFTYLDGSALLFSKWEAGQPNNFSGDQHYVELHGSDGEWEDEEITDRNDIVIEIPCLTCADIAPPGIIGAAATNNCPSTAINLSGIRPAYVPSGYSLTWHSSTPANSSNRIFNLNNVNVGTYYAAFYKSSENCFSGNGFNTTAVSATIGDCTGLVRQVNRTFDGKMNNLTNANAAEYGSVGRIYARELPANYPDGIGAIDNRLPNPRRISNMLNKEEQDQHNDRDMAGIFYIWGQFLDHDMGRNVTNRAEPAMIQLPFDEKLFTSPIALSRSVPAPGTGVTTPREQVNFNTSWIDGSQVYGTSKDEADWLRTFENGKLKVSKGDFLPYNTMTGEIDSPIDPASPSMRDDRGKTLKAFVAADERANEHTGTTSLHVLFLREHNRLCDKFVKQGWTDDEQIYQMARKIVGAYLQRITYTQWMESMGIVLPPYQGYNPSVSPDMLNTFATGAYRWHTLVENDIIFRDNECNAVGETEIPLKDVFFNSSIIAKYDIGVILKGLSVHRQYETDLGIAGGLRNFLDGNFGTDLASINIQRGRDHGLPSYNDVREYYTGSRASSFQDISSVDSIWRRMDTLYTSVDDVDLWIGLMAEPHESGKSIGKTIHAIIASQFTNMRDGDYYWYKNDPALRPYLSFIDATNLDDIISRNSTAGNFQDNIFFRKYCDSEGDDLAKQPCNVENLYEGFNYLGRSDEAKYYMIGDSPMTWDDANFETEALAGHLPKIDDQSENDILRQLLGGRAIWTDVTWDNNNFAVNSSDSSDDGESNIWRFSPKVNNDDVFVKDEKVSFFNWAPGQPNGNTAVNNRIEMRSDGLWSNLTRGNLRYAIVEQECQDISSSCPAGTAAPAIDQAYIENICPAATIDLSAIVSYNKPLNTLLTWHTEPYASDDNRIYDITALPAGIYYAAFYSPSDDCYNDSGSQTARIVTTLGDCGPNACTDDSFALGRYIQLNGAQQTISDGSVNVPYGSRLAFGVSSNGGQTIWSGPNGVVAFGESLFVSNNISSSNDGVYIARTSVNGCIKSQIFTLNLRDFDFDNDDVNDLVDLDDDNDGILDVDEMDCFGAVAFNGDEDSGTLGNIGTYSTITDHDVFGPDQIHFGGVTGSYLEVEGDLNNENTIVTMNFTSPVANIKLTALDHDHAETYFIRAYDRNGSLVEDITSFVIYQGANIAAVDEGGVGQSLSVTAVDASTHTEDPIAALELQLAFDVSKIEIERTDTDYTAGLHFGITDACIALDTDNDGLANQVDFDADGDGCLDANEYYGSFVDDDGDGQYGNVSNCIVGYDGKVLIASYAGNKDNVLNRFRKVGCLDTDNDGITNEIDLDDDNDGITDIQEGAVNGNFLDTDNDGRPNHLDLDSDNDGCSDANEYYNNGFADGADGGMYGAGVPIVNNSGRVVAASYIGAYANAINANAKDACNDNDQDGIPDVVDLDDDNDGILDTVEDAQFMADTDGDGILNKFDLDSDNDGINDVDEAGGIDLNRDGEADGDENNVGIPATAGNGLVLFDTDADTRPNPYDLDSDADGINDLVEAGNPLLVDANGDGQVDGNDPDKDGIVGAADGDPNKREDENDPAPVDTDNDGAPDYVDLDSDDDAFTDLEESGIANADQLDLDNDGRLDDLADDDGDGIAQVVDGDLNNYGDANDPALPDADNDNIPDYVDPFMLDTDMDGIPDLVDLDDDNDGITDVVENSVGGGDTDGDGIPNRLDLDSDNDGINDVDEAGGTDADRDGIADGAVGNDGIPATAGNGLLPPDTDGDGLVDHSDLDSDSDGINDLVESGNPALVDANGDGIVDGNDPDMDGIVGTADGDPNNREDNNDPMPVNTDGLGNPDYLDLDSDEDGLTDLDESGIPNANLLDQNNDGKLDNLNDFDGDGIAQVVDGMPNVYGDANNPALPDANNNNVPDYRDPFMLDTDMDGIPDLVDLDDDNDGILDTIEDSQLSADTDGDGIMNSLDLDSDNDGINDVDEAGGTDADRDGIADGAVNANGIPATAGNGIFPPDTDSDLRPNPYDLDSDADGINDLVESGNPVLMDANGDGVVDGNDPDMDGIVGAADGQPNGREDNNDPMPVNTDGLGNPDYLDLDSDDDGLTDLDESGIPNANLLDQNNDGKLDNLGDNDGDGIAQVVDGMPNAFGDANNPTLPDGDGDNIPDYRDGQPDTDMDGIPDLVDLDDDNDGILDTVEDAQLSADTDGDGVPNKFDLDSDNDGINDVDEAGGTDANRDGIADGPVGNDGIPATAGNGIFPPDMDGDQRPNPYDLDSDADGINDLVESGNPALMDVNGDGIVDGNDPDMDGIVGGADNQPIARADANDPMPVNTDGTDMPDYLDTDSDDDGLTDLDESGIPNADLLDQNDDGRVDDLSDFDGDGIAQVVDGMPNAFGDANNPALPDEDADNNPDYTDAPTPSVSIADVAVGEDVGTASVTVTLSNPSDAPVSVFYFTNNGTAVGGSDYATSSGTLTIPAGSTMGTIMIPVVDDNLIEGNETFVVRLTAPVGGTIADQEGTVTIMDDDAPVVVPNIAINDVTVDEDDGTASLTVSLDQPTTQNVTVNYTTGNGTAQQGLDFTGTFGTVTIPAGQTSATVSIPVLDDNMDEGTETFVVNIGSATFGNIADSQGLVTILDDDAPAVVPSITINDVTVDEDDGTASLTVSLDQPAAQNVTVSYTTGNGTAQQGLDFVGTSGTVTIPAGQTSATVSIPVLDDNTDEGTETFVVNIGSATFGNITDTQGLVTIMDDDAPAVVPNITINDVTVDEDGGAASLTVSLDQPAAQNVTVSYTTGNGTAQQGLDFVGTSGTVTIPAGQTSATVSIPVLDDNMDEGSETFAVNIGSATFGNITDTQGLVTILDDDAPAAVPNITINDVSVDENGGTASLTVSLDQPAAQNVTVSYMTGNGTAQQGTDFVGTSGTLTIPAGQTSATITVPVLDDNADEGDENFVVNLTGANGGNIVDNQGTVTILDDDMNPGGCNAQISVNGRTITVTGISAPITLVKVIDPNWTVLSECTPWAATTCGSSFSYTVPADGAYFVQVQTFTDWTNQVCNLLETVQVPGTGGGMPAASVNDVTVDENGGSATVVVSLNQPAGNSGFAVNYITMGTTATAGADFSPVTGTLFIQPGQSSGTISVPINDDTTFEPNETFDINLSSPNGGTLADNSATVTIVDNDAPTTPDVTISDVSVDENAGTAFVTVSLNAPAAQNVLVSYTTNGGTAQQGIDYSGVSGTLSIPAGQTSATISVPILDDNANEGDETFTVNLGAATGGNIVDAQGVVTILDNDAPVGGCNAQIAVNGRTITVTGIASPITLVKIIDNTWNAISECTPWSGMPCGNSFTYTVPVNGTYYVQVQTYADWSNQICNLLETVVINGGTGPVYDCPNLNANIGDACNDGNPNTEFDAVQGNCICAGTPIQIGCDNVVNGGTISGDETICAGATPSALTNVAFPSGGTGAIEYIWLSSTTSCPSALTQAIPGANQSTYQPGPLSQTTYFRRCARRAGCNNDADWLDGESNCVVVTVDTNPNCGGQTGGCNTTYSVSGNTININNITGAIRAVKVLDNTWKTIFSCDDWTSPCGGSESVTVPSNGIYWVQIQTYADWSTPICDILESVSVGGNAPRMTSTIFTLDAAVQQNAVELDWTNNTGSVVSHFELERSTDGQTFENIGEIDVENIDDTPTIYSSKDDSPFVGFNYYRVKMVNLDGNHVYSTTKRLTIADLEDFGLFPNPAQGTANVSLKGLEGNDIEIQLINQFGRRIKVIALDEVSETTYSIDLNNVRNGIYTLWIFTEGKKPVGKKLIVNKLY